jgi:hypothetical protein
MSCVREISGQMNDNKNQIPETNFALAGSVGDVVKRAKLPCAEWEESLIQLAAGEELPAEVHAGWMTHAAECDSCATAFAQEREILALISEGRSDPDAMLLASCRASLEDAIDREEERGWVRRSAEFLLPSSWLAPSPAWSAAVLIVIGFSTGLLLGPRVLHRFGPGQPDGPNVAGGAGANGNDLASNSGGGSSALTALDLHTADVAGINVLPSSGDDQAPQVELQLQAQRPVTVQGTVDNGDVKNLLLNVLAGGERFSPDVRLDAVDLLRTRNNDPKVRAALCQAVRTDRNAAVRLKALEALNGAEPEDIVQRTLLSALVDDQNPGVRVEAVNELRDMASKGQVSADDQMMSVLQDRMAKDPNAYIRLQSAAAIRELGPRGKY